MKDNLKLINSVILSSILVIIFIPAITIAAEFFPPLKDWLKNTFTHHWIGKSVISVILFLVLSLLIYLAPQKATSDRVISLIRVLVVLTTFGILAIFSFFYWEIFLK